jgi:hypothetical protein
VEVKGARVRIGAIPSRMRSRPCSEPADRADDDKYTIALYEAPS